MHQPHDKLEDKELLKNFYKDHNNEWLGILFPRYTLLLLGVCMRYLNNEEDAKDAVQQVFLKAINELHKYRVEFFKSWIYMITKNYCLMKLRESGKKFVELSKDLSDGLDDPDDNKYVAAKETTLTEMEQALSHLNKEQQQCVSLFYLEKKSYQEITTMTGFTMMQVKSSIQNGKRNLKLALQKVLQKD
ncbi:MAG: sigma-70 family RNA polymerase sigma factor [Ferruginibacter sp.]